MAALDPKIEAALGRFAHAGVADSARFLFEVLGYSSPRRVDLEPNTAAEFRSTFDPARQLDEQKALLDDWISVDFLFQLTDEEIGNHLAFSTGKFENSIIESYLFLAIQLSGSSYTRTKLATATREVNKRFPMPVMILFRHGETLTLAIIDRELNRRDSEKDVLRKVTLIKDIRISDPHRAHLEILSDLSLHSLHESSGFRSFVELHRAFAKTLDSSELNKRFFIDITNWYLWATQKAKGVVYPRDVDAASEEARSIFFIRLLTRIIFCWFLQERGLIPRRIFRWNQVGELLKDTRPESGSYYRAILQNLFFATLNREPEKREFRDKKSTGRYDANRGVHTLYRYEDLLRDPGALLELLKSVPFVNGGLFDCLDEVYRKAEGKPVVRLDGFSDNPRESVTIPNRLLFGGEIRVDLHEEYNDQRRKAELVQGLIDILARYKFTVEENTPIEQEIALDPELLGKVFENLLATYNPDTRTTARKKIGAFYTPRDVVQYMVDEALIAELHGTPEAKLRDLLSDQPTKPLDEAETTALIASIENIRVLDPACGSGAFLMGTLHRLVHLLSKLDPNNRQWKQRQREAVLRFREAAERNPEPESRESALRNIEARLEDIKQSFDETQHDLDFARKLYLIENSIYGVDIQPIACQIAKLRFLIALLVDQKAGTKIRPLPNLETRLVAADSLTPIEKAKDHQMFIGADQVEALRERLRQVRHNHFNARTPEDKQRYREEDAAIREELALELRQQGMPNDTARLLAGWDPYNQNTHAAFFDPEWMFSLDPKTFTGFDIVIGNPPYVRQEQIKELKPSLKKHYECYSGTADLYVYFYERGIQLLKTGGVFSFITSNKWFRSGYGEKLREWLRKNTQVRRLVDFGDAEIFDAIAYPCIVILSKGAPSESTEFRAMTWRADWKPEDAGRHLTGDTFIMPQRDLAPDAWRLEGGLRLRLLDRIRAGGVALGKYVNGRFYYGIKTGLNEAFVVSREKRDELIAEHSSSAQVIKPFLRGRDVKRWRVEFEEQYLLFIPWHFPLHKDGAIVGPSAKAEREFAKRFPAVYDHLSSFKPQLAARNSAETGIRYEWYALQRWGAEYSHEFEHHKIIYPDIFEHQSFAWDEKGYYGANTCYFIPTNDKWLIAVLNSKVVEWFYSQISNKVRGGYMRAFSDYMGTVPIPPASDSQKQLSERLSEYLIFLGDKGEIQSAVASYLERLLNGLVYEMYFEPELHALNLTFFAHLEAARPPKLNSVVKSQRAALLQEFHAKVADLNHPLYACQFALNGVEVVRIIEGKDQVQP
jgi:adenine-specific DNA-methyltransferase